MMVFGTFTPTAATAAGSMLLDGELIATVTSLKTGQHVSLRMRCENDFGAPAKFKGARQVVITDFDGELMGRYLARGGVLIFTPMASRAMRWTVSALLRYLAGDLPEFAGQAELYAAEPSPA